MAAGAVTSSPRTTTTSCGNPARSGPRAAPTRNVSVTSRRLSANAAGDGCPKREQLHHGSLIDRRAVVVPAHAATGEPAVLGGGLRAEPFEVRIPSFDRVVRIRLSEQRPIGDRGESGRLPPEVIRRPAGKDRVAKAAGRPAEEPQGGQRRALVVRPDLLPDDTAVDPIRVEAIWTAEGGVEPVEPSSGDGGRIRRLSFEQ